MVFREDLNVWLEYPHIVMLSKYSIIEQLFPVLKNMIFALPSSFTLQKSIDKRLVQDIVKIKKVWPQLCLRQLKMQIGTSEQLLTLKIQVQSKKG